MSKQKKDKEVRSAKIGGSKAATKTSSVREASLVDTVGAVDALKGASGVQGVRGATIRKAGRTMTLAERTQLFAMIDEETEKVLGGSGFSARHKELVRSAVRMAIDAGLVEEEGATPPANKK